jgi:hypothetical protein
MKLRNTLVWIFLLLAGPLAYFTWELTHMRQERPAPTVEMKKKQREAIEKMWEVEDKLIRACRADPTCLPGLPREERK